MEFTTYYYSTSILLNIKKIKDSLKIQLGNVEKKNEKKKKTPIGLLLFQIF